MYLNQFTVIGFTGQDAEFHYTPNDTPMPTLSVATSPRAGVREIAVHGWHRYLQPC